MQIIRFLFIFLSIGLAAIGQVILKLGMSKVGQINLGVSSMITTFTQPLVIFGLFFYGVSLILWLVILSKENLSFVYPMVALSYVVTTILARFLLHEQVPSIRWLGLGCIMLGIVMVARS